MKSRDHGLEPLHLGQHASNTVIRASMQHDWCWSVAGGWFPADGGAVKLCDTPVPAKKFTCTDLCQFHIHCKTAHVMLSSASQLPPQRLKWPLGAEAGAGAAEVCEEEGCHFFK